MKKELLFLMTCTTLLFFAGFLQAQPQSYDLNTMPMLDPRVKSGVLDNGMRYFIRANKIPANRGEFFIANGIGAIQENDDQNGLAHFTEHMSFNGTANFPGKGILDYLATIGVKFGTNVNAGTSIEQTVYNVSNVPLRREGILDSVLMILHDWSHFVSLEEKEIDLERGVIVEEWRMYGTADERMNNKLAPVIYKGSKYANRNVIGDTAVLKHFKYETLRDFYKKWYRPDLQALVIIGDFDENVVEAKIRKLLSDIPKNDTPCPKEANPLPDNAEPLIGTATDKEATSTSVDVAYKHNVVKDEDKNLGYMRLRLVRSLINNMFGKRMREIARSENPPFLSASSYYGGFTRTKDAFSGTAQAANNEAVKALTALLTEMERMKRFGFLDIELERARADLLKSYESSYLERDKRKNRELVYANVSYFLYNNPNPGIEFDYAFANAMIPGITLKEINEEANRYVTDENMIVTVTGPEKEGITIPTEQEIRNVLATYKNSKIGPYVDLLAGKKLVSREPVPGKVVSTGFNKDFGATEWILSNGMKVVFRPSDIREDELMITGFREGGTSLLKEEDLPSAALLGDAVSQMGIGEFSATDLEKMMSGKRVSLRMSTTDERDGFFGNVSPKDLETALQLIYLSFVQPRWNAADYKTWMEKVRARYINAESEPRKAFRDTVSLLMADHHPRIIPMSYRLLDKVSYEKLQSIYQDRFSDPGNFTLIFSGKIEPEKVRPLFEKYLASLPTLKRDQKYRDNGVRTPKGKVTRDFRHESKTPRTTVYVNYNGSCDYTAQNSLLGAALRHVMELRYVESIREDEGGAYSVRVQFLQNRFPVPATQMIVSFETDPAKADKLVSIIHKIMNEMVEAGPSDTDLQKAKEYFLKQRQEDMKENSWWLNTMDGFYFYGIDRMSGYEDRVRAMDLKAVHEFAKQVLTQGNIVQVVMRP